MYRNFRPGELEEGKSNARADTYTSLIEVKSPTVLAERICPCPGSTPNPNYRYGMVSEIFVQPAVKCSPTPCSLKTNRDREIPITQRSRGNGMSSGRNNSPRNARVVQNDMIRRHNWMDNVSITNNNCTRTAHPLLCRMILRVNGVGSYSRANPSLGNSLCDPESLAV